MIGHNKWINLYKKIEIPPSIFAAFANQFQVDINSRFLSAEDVIRLYPHSLMNSPSFTSHAQFKKQFTKLLRIKSRLQLGNSDGKLLLHTAKIRNEDMQVRYTP